MPSSRASRAFSVDMRRHILARRSRPPKRREVYGPAGGGLKNTRGKFSPWKKLQMVWFGCMKLGGEITRSKKIFAPTLARRA